VDTVPKLAAACMELFEQDRVALDVEHHSLHTYAGMTCLVQLSTGEWQVQGGAAAGQGRRGCRRPADACGVVPR
jgi:hypothetical protein